MRRALIPFVLFAALAILVPAADAPARPRLKGRFKAVIADTDASLYQVKYFDDGAIYASGADGHFVASLDEGKEWEATQLERGVAFRVMHWSNRRTVLLGGRKSGKNVILFSRNRGGGFNKRFLDTDLPIRDFAFFTPRTGWAVLGSVKSKDGAWRQTTDGATSFKKIESVAYANPARAILGISQAGKKGLFAVGSRVEMGYVGDAAKSLLFKKKTGCVLKSTDEGKRWEVLDAGNPAGTILYDVDFFDEKLGWVVGEKGFAAKTADGGKTWTKITTGTEERLNAVQVIDENAAYAVGENGVAIGTNDGGKKVVTFRTDTKRDLKDLSFLDERRGFVVGTSGTVLKFVREY